MDASFSTGSSASTSTFATSTFTSTSTTVSASTSTYAAANPNDKSYAIFINHRGPDVKATFARSLYLRLLEKGLTAFLDEGEMQPGYNITSQLEQVVRTATVHVAIFSPRYAESAWCLDELVMMLESGAPIVPVFYRVTPAHVRWTLGDYGRALETHEKKRTHENQARHHPDTITKWRNALFQVANNSGFELETSNGKELQLELLDNVVKGLLEMVKPKTPESLHVAKFPTGLDEKLKDFEDRVLWQQQQRGRPQLLGIWGLGGVGKTTLAKEFFNTKKSDYHRSCFLFDVKANAQKGSLTSLQRELLKSLSGLDKPIKNVDEGTGMLQEHIKKLISSNASLHRKHLHSLTGLDESVHGVDEGKEMHINRLKSSDTLRSNNNILVILDDVDHVDQVSALLPVDLPSGSLIVITSRDKHILIASKVENSSIYNLTGLKQQHSLELFCSYAFGQTYPHPGFESIVYSFLDACNGLPLSLKVFGANLYGRDISYWKEELGSLPTEIKERYKVSYDALDNEEKQMFLDIACFLIGENRDTAICIWEASGWKARRGFQNLQDRCLVEVDSSNLISMHDHLRDLGRDVAEESSPLRLWRWTQNAIDDLSQQSSNGQVIPMRGIKIDLNEYKEDDDVLCIIRTTRLQILHTEGFLLERILKTAKSPNILWIRWKDCPFSSLPSWIPMKTLRILHVSGRILNTLWQREGESQAPLQLPVCLEEFSANGCVQLKSIRGLEELTKLRRLDVGDCSDLEELPSMERLTSLEELYTKGCVKLKSIRGLEHATKLRILDVDGMSELEELPSMEPLTSLEELWAEGCVKLKSIRGLEHATKLRILDVGGLSELEELPSMEPLTSLEELRAKGCVKLKSIRGLGMLTKLRKLSLRWCCELEEVEGVEELTWLEKLDVFKCPKLQCPVVG